MSLSLRPNWVCLFLISGLIIFLTACGSQQSTEIAVLPAPSPTATIIPTIVTPLPPPTIAATSTSPPPPPPPPTATAIPTEPPTPTPTPTITPTPRPVPTEPKVIDRTCPDPWPGQPPYDRYYLPFETWPEPVNNPETHLWFTKPLPPGGGRLLINTDYPYGWDNNDRLLLHNGIDVSVDLGTPILAPANGTVVYAGLDDETLFGWRCNWYGELVIILHDDEWQDQPVYSLFGHIQNISVEPGQPVVRREQIAEVGSTGVALVRHLHYELRVGTNEFSSTRNPMLWFEPGAGRGIVAGRLVDPNGYPWQGVVVRLESRDGDETKNQVSWTYLGDSDNLMNPDEHLAENFVFPDVAAGEYTLYVLSLQGRDYSTPITVRAGEINTVEIETRPYQ